MESKAWYIKFPCDAYALGPVRFPDKVNEKAVRSYTREWAGVKKLPKGFECWTTND